MKLTTEEKQYLEIYLWNDYNEKLTVKKGELKPQNKFNFSTGSPNSNIINKTRRIRFS